MPPKKGTRRRGWGSIRPLPSGRYQASYTGPDLRRHAAVDTFETKLDAEVWLGLERGRVSSGTWTPPKGRAEEETPSVLTVGEYSEAWLADRDIRPTTRRLYRHALDAFILPALGARPLDEVTVAEVDHWGASVRRRTGPTQHKHSTALLRTIYSTAVDQGLVEHNPCRAPRARGTSKPKRLPILSPAELSALADAMPANLRCLVLVGGWCGLRLGELLELRRGDVDLEAGTVRVDRQVQHRPHEAPDVVPPKSDAGHRTVHAPTFVVEALRAHLAEYVGPSKDALLFARDDGTWLVPSTVRRTFKRAAVAALGRDDLHPHDLRHSAATLAARAGATTAELMARIGHTSMRAVEIYQHAARDADARIARGLDDLAGS